jgi:hypothetical protein
MLIASPALCKPLTADSRPAPGPERLTSTSFIPSPIALFAASWAATVAAKADDFLDPEYPLLPADAQAIIFPVKSVMETIVLLNVALTCAIPLGTVLCIFFLAFATVGFLTIAAFCVSCFAKIHSPLLLLIRNSFPFSFTRTRVRSGPLPSDG